MKGFPVSMSPSSRAPLGRGALPLVVLLVTSSAACGESVQVGSAPQAAGPARSGRPRASGPRAPRASADGGVDAGTDASVARVYRDEDFVEVDTYNRDPFRDFVIAMAASEVPIVNPREVLMHDVAVEQMRLIAIITGVATPYAMILDDHGIGHVVMRGNYIGRDEVVNVGGADGMPVALNWKVDRIRSGEIILSREDPLHPDQPPLTRSMLLREAGDDARTTVGVVTGQLTNTGDVNPAAAGGADVAPGTPGPAAPTLAGAPPPPGSRPSGSYGEYAPPPPPPPSAPQSPPPAPSSSRFGGVFNRRTPEP